MYKLVYFFCSGLGGVIHAFPLFQKEMLVKHVSCRMVSFPKNHSRPMHSETMSQGVGTWILTIQKIQVSIHSLRKVLELLVVLQVQVLFLPGHDSIGLEIPVLCITPTNGHRKLFQTSQSFALWSLWHSVGHRTCSSASPA